MTTREIALLFFIYRDIIKIDEIKP